MAHWLPVTYTFWLTETHTHHRLINTLITHDWVVSPLTCWVTHLLAQWFTYSWTYWLKNRFIYQLTHSLRHSHAHNRNHHTAFLRGIELQTGLPAFSCSHMFMAKMADYPALSRQSGPSFSESISSVVVHIRTSVIMVLFQSTTYFI